LTEYLTIASRFHGPPDAGNGGYVVGLLAHYIEGPAQEPRAAPRHEEEQQAPERRKERHRREQRGH